MLQRRRGEGATVQDIPTDVPHVARLRGSNMNPHHGDTGHTEKKSKRILLNPSVTSVPPW